MRRPRPAPPATAAPWWFLRTELWLALALAAGALLPILARQAWRFGAGFERIPDGIELAWSWDVAGALTQAPLFHPSWVLALFLVACPLLGITLLVMRSRASRSTLTHTMLWGAAGLLALVFLQPRIAQFLGRGQAVLGVIVSAATLAGLLVARARPDAERGYRLAAIAAAVGLLLMVLPISPDPLSRDPDAARTSALLNIFRALDLEKIGPLVFLAGIVGLVGQLLALSLWLPGAGRPGRARATFWVLVGSLGLAQVLPLLILPLSGAEVPWMVVLVPVVSVVTLRVVPLLVLLALGLASWMLLRMDEVPKAADAFGERRSLKEVFVAIQRAHAALAAGRLDGEGFRARKLAHLRDALALARTQDQTDRLLGYAAHLRQLGAMNDVEFRSLAEAVA